MVFKKDNHYGFHHDELTVLEFLAEKAIPALLDPSLSFDLAPFDFFAFPKWEIC